MAHGWVTSSCCIEVDLQKRNSSLTLLMHRRGKASKSDKLHAVFFALNVQNLMFWQSLKGEPSVTVWCVLWSDVVWVFLSHSRKVSGVRDLFIKERSSPYELVISLFIGVEWQVSVKVVILLILWYCMFMCYTCDENVEEDFLERREVRASLASILKGEKKVVNFFICRSTLNTCSSLKPYLQFN